MISPYLGYPLCTTPRLLGLTAGHIRALSSDFTNRTGLDPVKLKPDEIEIALKVASNVERRK